MKKINLLEEETLPKEKTPPALSETESLNHQKPPSRKNLVKKALLLIGILLLLVVLAFFFLIRPLLALKDKVKTLSNQASEFSQLFESQDFKSAIGQIEVIDQSLDEIKASYTKLGWARFLPFLGRFYKDGEHLLESGQFLLEAADIAGQALIPYYDILGFEEKEEEKDEDPMTVEERLTLVLDTLDKITPQFDEIIGKLNLAKTEIEKIDPQRYPEKIFGQKVRERMIGATGLIESLAEVATEIKPIVAYLRPLLGIPDEKTYFLLFQNDAELRPSGGFMTAYAFLSVKSGKFTPLGSHDIYTLDSQFGNRLKAPEPILAYLPDVKYWHLRDMNLSPDFWESMNVFWKNYQKLPGARQVDGIIALDTQVLVDILRVLGEIGVSGWGNFSAEIDPRCDCPQVFYELEKYADKPVSTWREERKAIIGPLMHSILGNMMGSPRIKWPEFLDVFFTSIKEKHLLFAFFDEDLQGAIEALNAGGRIKDFEGDYFHLNDCNFAGAKSNMYIREEIVQEIKKESDGSLVKTVTIDYKNPAPASNCNLEKGDLCLNGYYRNWFRLYVPEGSKLIESTGSEIEVKTYDEFGKTVFEGFYGLTPSTSLKPEGKLTLTFKYRLPFKASEEGFNLLVQKQPGTANHSYEVRFGGKIEKFELDGDKELQL
jgi:hypothetical protein